MPRGARSRTPQQEDSPPSSDMVEKQTGKKVTNPHPTTCAVCLSGSPLHVGGEPLSCGSQEAHGGELCHRVLPANATENLTFKSLCSEAE